jgi:mycothiol synthase
VDVLIRETATEEEKRRALEIYNTVEPDDAVTREDAARFEASALAFVELLASIDGRDVGSAACLVYPQNPGSAFTLVDVLPHARRVGAGQAMYEACSAFARVHGCEQLTVRVDANDEESLGFAVRRGFVVQQRENWLELDVASSSVPIDAPAGVRIVDLIGAPDLAPGAFDVACESVPDIPGEDDWSPPPRESFLATLPDTTFLAVAGDEVVGYAILRRYGDAARHGMTAVKRAWRGRGIALALKSAQIEWARANGITRLRTANEQRNVPMQTLNLRLGYVPAGGRVVLRGPLS